MTSSTKTAKTVLFAPHMAPLVAVANILGIDFSTFKPKESFAHPVGRDQFQQITGLVNVIPTMKLKPEHVTEVAETSEKLVHELRVSGQQDPELVTKLTEHLLDASNKLIDNNHAGQNGNAGNHLHATPGAGALDRQVADEQQ
jgi:hypothetical protein